MVCFRLSFTKLQEVSRLKLLFGCGGGSKDDEDGGSSDAMVDKSSCRTGYLLLSILLSEGSTPVMKNESGRACWICLLVPIFFIIGTGGEDGGSSNTSLVPICSKAESTDIDKLSFSSKLMKFLPPLTLSSPLW